MKLDRIMAVRFVVLACLFAGAASFALAHHSQTMFDLSKTVTIQGTITEVDWANPHSLFFLDGKDVSVANAAVVNYCLEGQSPNFLIGNGEGWKPDTLKVGDKITVHGNPRKDGKPTILMLDLIAADGKHYTSKSPFPAE